MILIITTTALAVICVYLVVALYLMRKKLTASREAAIATLLASANLLKSIENGIRKFNKEYDVQLRLEEAEENGYKRFTLQYFDPKEDKTEPSDADTEPANVDTPEDK